MTIEYSLSSLILCYHSFLLKKTYESSKMAFVRNKVVKGSSSRFCLINIANPTFNGAKTMSNYWIIFLPNLIPRLWEIIYFSIGKTENIIPVFKEVNFARKITEQSAAKSVHFFFFCKKFRAFIITGLSLLSKSVIKV